MFLIPCIFQKDVCVGNALAMNFHRGTLLRRKTQISVNSSPNIFNITKKNIFEIKQEMDTRFRENKIYTYNNYLQTIITYIILK